VAEAPPARDHALPGEVWSAWAPPREQLLPHAGDAGRSSP
jgi:hypothetical protein